MPFPRLPGIAGAALLPVILAAGCATPEKPPAQSYILPSAPAALAAPDLNVGLTQPPLKLGDTFAFDNPVEQWEVTAIDGPFVAWHSKSGDYMQTAWSTLLPPLRWGGNISTMDAGQRRLTQVQGRFFPLKTGNRVTFFEERINARPGGTSNGRWECEVGKEAEIVVPAGKAQTWEVTCLLNGRERVFLNYAENLGHYVRYAYESGNGPVVRQLVGYARAQPAEKPAPTTSPNVK